MKGVFVFNHINDIVFINTDEPYKRHIQLKAVEVGLIQKEDIDGSLDSNVVLQLLSPLIASQRFMIGQLNDPYTSIRGDGHYIMVFKQFSGYIFLAINGDGTETEEYLNRKLCVLHRIITFLHGPCLQEIRPDKQRERNVRWKLIGQMLVTWADLYENQQSFLVEALERLHVNDKVNKTSVELLEAALNGMKASGEKQAVHAMLVAHTKLLALFSSRSATDMSGGDQLMFILLANMLFKDSKGTATRQPGMTRMASRETIKPTRSSRGPVKIGKNFGRENSNTPLLDGNQSNSSESEFNPDSEVDDFIYDGFSSENKESEDSTDSQSTLQTSGRSGQYPKLSQNRSSSTNISGHRQPLSKTDDEESTLDRNYRSITTSLPHLSVISKRNSLHGDPRDHNNQQHHKQYLEVEEAQLQKSLSVESSLSVRHLNNVSDSSQTTGNGLQRTVVDNRGNAPNTITDPLHTSDTSTPSLSSSSTALPTNKPTEVPQKPPASSQDDFLDYHKMTVMLQQGDVINVPHSVHCVLIMEGIYLVIVCEVARVTHAKTITQSLDAGNELLSALDPHQGKTYHTKQAYDTVEGHVKRLGDILKKSKGMPYVERIIVDIGQKWETAKQCELLKHLDPRYNVHGQARSNQLNKLEGCMSTMLDKLQELFRVLYLVKRAMTPDLHQSIVNGVEAVQGAMTRCLSDYKDYINIMAHRNMPMTIYVDEFPGMVHFIFVNRSSNVMVAPSFHESLYQEEEHPNNASKLVKEKVWSMFAWFQQRLTSGTTSITAREGDLHFSYFIWFEDNQGGFAVAPPVSVDVAVGSIEDSLPGTISNPFYSTLQKRCFPGQDKKNICFYELMCVHVSMVPTQLALAHCRKLKDKLWKVSVDTNSPISLL